MYILTIPEIHEELQKINSRESNNFLEYYFNDIFLDDGNNRSKNKFIPVIIKDGEEYIGKVMVIDKETLNPLYSTPEFIVSENIFFLFMFIFLDEPIHEYFNDSRSYISLWLLNGLHFLYSKELIRKRALSIEEKLKLKFNHDNNES